ncbi:NUC185 domain-containing protein [Scheffersomyces coipomensis]|uniref:NUC185 domain-containing protein n=1 Tax=Scheffersomyces coipomensis TaxID=1788519 RepID=UPI00315CD75D
MTTEIVDQIEISDLIIDPYTKTSYVKPESKNNSFINEILEPSNELSWDILDLVQQVPEVNKLKLYEELLAVPQSISRTSYRFKRSGLNGDVTRCTEEIQLSEVENANSSNSLSINRKYTAKGDSLSGKSTFLPFQPGGIVTSSTKKDATEFLHRNEVGLFDWPQGLSRGLHIPESKNSDTSVIELGQAQEAGDEGSDDKLVSEWDLQKETKDNGSKVVGTLPYDSSEIDGLVPLDYSSIKNESNEDKEKDNKSWAHVVELDHKIENFNELVPNMAREWPFELDTFQKEAVYHLEQGDSVFVAAHTSAGKTVVAEYAIAMANRNMTKTIYTSPIKALSNQKFRDFKETFKDADVGLITGDVQINPEANCLIMTTEILRSMLYRGADLIRDVEFVIFDEVHYVNDIDRGVVWEEVIIMLPDHVKFILLSATVPNTFEFANWIGRTKRKDIYVISTHKRPVPLEIFIGAKDQLFKVVNAQRQFVESEFKKHKDLLEKKKEGPPNAVMGSGSRGGPGGSARGGNRGGGQVATRGRGNFQGKPRFGQDGPNKNTWISLVQYLKKENLLPAVVFVFSKKKCEDYADSLKGVDFCNARDKSEIHMFIDRAVARLKKEDRELPQIIKVREMLSRGIAVHHGGLLPIVKECIEILFSKTLVKVLFATETFAMGLNLPTRTVVFSSTRKHDGRSFRNLLPGEFTQMSGRAGRRGLDPTGTVIVMAYNDPISQLDFKEIALGMPTKLSSQFRLTYNMILNLLRIEALKVEEMIKHSFSENSAQVLLPENQKKVEKLSIQLKDIEKPKCFNCKLESMMEVYDLVTKYEKLYGESVIEIHKSATLKTQILKIGRATVFRDKSDCVKLGFVVRSDSANSAVLLLTFNHGAEYENDVEKFKQPFIPHKTYLKNNFKKIKYSGNLRVESVPYNKVVFICRYGLKSSISDILRNDTEVVNEAVNHIKVLLKFQFQWEELELGKSASINLHNTVIEKNNILTKLDITLAFYCAEFKEHYQIIHKIDTLQTEIDHLNRLISDENLDLLPDYEQRLQVLGELGFIDEQQNVVLKGRVACEINSGWELIITELVLDNFLGDFEAEEIVALLSCFVYEGRTNEDEPPCITPRLEKGKTRILEIAKKMIGVYSEKQVILTSEEEEFLERKRFALMNVVYEWARGLSFNEIMEMSVEAEGTIVRVITRLDEICREVKNAALIVGDSTLHAKMSEAQERIKRDIVFCASLYL